MVVTMHLLVEDNMALPALEVVYYVYPSALRHVVCLRREAFSLIYS